MVSASKLIYSSQKVKFNEHIFYFRLITPLVQTTLKGNRVLYCYLLDPDVQKFVYKDAVRYAVI